MIWGIYNTDVICDVFCRTNPLFPNFTGFKSIHISQQMGVPQSVTEGGLGLLIKFIWTLPEQGFVIPILLHDFTKRYAANRGCLKQHRPKSQDATYTWLLSWACQDGGGLMTSVGQRLSSRISTGRCRPLYSSGTRRQSTVCEKHWMLSSLNSLEKRDTFITVWFVSGFVVCCRCHRSGE